MSRGHAKQKKANRPRHKVAGVDRHWAEMHGYFCYVVLFLPVGLNNRCIVD